MVARPKARPPLGLPKAARLLSRVDYDRASRGAASVTTTHFKIVRGAGQGEGPRLGLIVPRKVGGAVARNRVKRRLREWFRVVRPDLSSRMDIIVIARPGAERLSFASLVAEVTEGLERAGRGRGRGARRPAPSP